MPPLPPAPNVLRIHMEFALGSAHSGGSAFHVDYTGGPPTDAQLSTAAAGVGTAFAAHLANQMFNGYYLDQVTVTDLTSPTSAQGIDGTHHAGGDTNSPPTIDTCTLINFGIARRYRGGKPKIFLPLGTDADIDPDFDTWTPAYRAVTNTNWAAFITALTALTGIGCTISQQVSVSYYEGFASSQNPITKRWRNIPTPRTGDAVIDPIVSVECSALISQQKRRRVTAPAP